MSFLPLTLESFITEVKKLGIILSPHGISFMDEDGKPCILERYESGVVNPEFVDLEKILWYFCPNISYLWYKKIERLIFTEEEKADYYERNHDYTYLRIYVEDLFECLMQIELLKTHE